MKSKLKCMVCHVELVRVGDYPTNFRYVCECGVS